MSRELDEKETTMVKRYFDFDLSESELETFNNRLESDKDFAKEVEKYELAYNTVDDLILKNRTIGDSPSSDTGVKMNPPKKNYLGVALLGIVLVAALLVGYFMMNSPSSETSNEAIFAQADEYTRMMSDDILLRNDEASLTLTPEELELKTIITEYENTKDVNTTITKLNTYLSTYDNPNNEELAEWWKANIYMQNQDVENAIGVLESIQGNTDYNSSQKATTLLKELK